MPPAHDPPSLFLLELFRYIDRYQSRDKFLEVLRDKDRGKPYRAYAGINMDNIPTKGTFSNFNARLGPDLYNEIFQILVGIFQQLQMISFKILAHDGTLFPTRAGAAHIFQINVPALKLKKFLTGLKAKSCTD